MTDLHTRHVSLLALRQLHSETLLLVVSLQSGPKFSKCVKFYVIPVLLFLCKKKFILSADHFFTQTLVYTSEQSKNKDLQIKAQQQLNI